MIHPMDYIIPDWQEAETAMDRYLCDRARYMWAQGDHLDALVISREIGIDLRIILDEAA